MEPSDAEILRNPKFQSFGNELVTCLQRFDKVKEWPDLVKQIQKLQKVLQRYPQFSIIPVKLTFCKRMAQCLNPTLPSGVHLKALQTFKIVFERLGADRMAKDLAIYSMGIFPLFQYAAIPTKPVILEIYEKYYLGLGPKLLPCLSGLLISILPGLEEESGEHYDRVLKLMDDICAATQNPQIFYRAIWKAILIAPVVRFPAINYLNAKIPKEVYKNPENVKIYLPETQQLVYAALKASLSGNNILTQRSTMESILNHFPISSGIFTDWESLSVCVVKLVLCKEVALNRRLYSWFLGSKPEDFEEYGKKVLIKAVTQLFSYPPDTKAYATEPFRIMVSLLEKREIGESVIENILVSIFFSLHRFKDGYQFSRELKLSANTLLEKVEPKIIWDGAARLFIENCEDSIGVIDSLIDILRCDEETRQLHLPNLLKCLLDGIDNIAKRGDFAELYKCLQLAKKVFGKFAGIAPNSTEELAKNPELVNQLQGLYKALSSFQDVLANLFDTYMLPHFEVSSDNETLHYLPLGTGDEAQQQRRKIITTSIQLLVSLFIYLPSCGENEGTVLPPWLKSIRTCSHVTDPEVSFMALSAFVELMSSPNSGINANIQNYIHRETTYVKETVIRLWKLSHSDYSDMHFQIAQTISRLLKISKQQTNELIGNFLLAQDPEEKVEACRRFALLWRLISDRSETNPLAENVFLMLDTLSDPQPMVSLAGRTWLAECRPKAERILEPLLLALLDPNIVQHNQSYVATFDTRRIVYVLNLLKDILNSDFAFVPADREFRGILAVMNEQQESHAGASNPPMTSPIPVRTFVDLLIVIGLRFISGGGQEAVGGSEFVSGVQVVQSTSASFLRHFLLKLSDKRYARFAAKSLQARILSSLDRSVHDRDLVLQVQLLRLLKVLVQIQQSDGVGSDPDSSRDPHLLSPLSSNSSGDLTESSRLTSLGLFLPTITTGLETTSSTVRFYWLEFISFLLPRYKIDLKRIVTPICNCLCNIISGFGNVHAFQLSEDMLAILETLQLIISLCAMQKNEPDPNAASAGGVIDVPFSFFSKFLPGGEQVPISDPIPERREFFNTLPFLFKSTLFVWQQPTGGDDELANKFLIQDRIVKMFDPLIAAFPNEFLFAVMQVLERSRQEGNKSLTMVLVEMFNAMDSVNPVVFFRSCATFLAEVLRSKSRTDVQKSFIVHEMTVLDFVNCYLNNNVAGDAELLKAQPYVLQLVKEGMISRSPHTYLQMIRLVNTFALKVAANEDKRHRKELAEVVYNLVSNIARDACNAQSRIIESRDEKMNERVKSISLKSLKLLAEIVPKLYELVSEDKDKAILNVLPTLLACLRDHSESNLPWSTLVLQLLCKLNEYDYSINSWKKEILSIFRDDSFFLTNFVGFDNWRKVINFLMTRDATIFPELLRTPVIVVKPFANKEQLAERTLKRMSFVIFAGEVDQYAGFLPSIQEKLLEALKMNHAHGVFEQVFLCMRILLLRFSHKRLTSFWPTILFEMIRIFSSLGKSVESSPGTGKIAESPGLILELCKFLDIALLVPAEQFKLYEWIFILDYFDPPLARNSFVPYIEQLTSFSSTESPIKLNVPVANEKQPLILLRNVENLEQIYSYVRHYSEAAYQNLITGGEATQSIIEAVITSDMIEFINVDGFSNTPERLVQERAAQNLQRLGHTLKLDLIKPVEEDNILEDEEDEDVFQVASISMNWPTVEELRTKYHAVGANIAEWMTVENVVYRVVSQPLASLMNCETQDGNLVQLSVDNAEFYSVVVPIDTSEQLVDSSD